jgi:conjugative transfer signal peptidase TraF
VSRAGYFWITYLILWFVGLTWIFRPSPHLLWNASPSVPIGLYALSKIDTLKPGDLVAAKPPPALSRFMAERFYLPEGLPLIKHVGAVPGDTVCRQGQVIFIDGDPVATAEFRDHLGRTLPAWQGCHRLAAKDVFLLNSEVPDSFDGRYFGVLPLSSVLGRTVPLFTRTGEAQP